MARHRRPVGWGVVAGVVGMTGRAFVPAALGRAIDRGMLPHDTAALVGWAAVILGLVLVQAAATVVQERCDFASMMGAGLRVLGLVNEKAARAGVTLTGRSYAGEGVAIGTGDIEPIGGALAATSRGAGGLVAIVVVAAVMLLTSWELGLVVLVGVPLVVWLVALALRPLRERQHRVRLQQGTLTALALDTVTGLRVLHGFGGQERFAQRYRDASQQTRRLAVEAARADSVLAAVKSLLPGALGALVVWFGAHLTLTHRLEVGQLVAFYGYSMFLATPLRWFTDSAEALTRGQVSAERVCRFLGRERDLPEGSGSRWPTEGALVDPGTGLSVERGCMTAVAYTSASGAARVADRLGRYVESDATAGGVALRDVADADLRRNVLVVTDEDVLFRGVAAEELDPAGRYGPDGLLALADAACAADVIEALPGALGGEVQPAGRNFSGGERQRLRLLRALAYDPQVLVLVEPASALDALTEARLAQRLADARRGRTTVVFTTSPLLLARADRVALLHGESVVADGTHEALLRGEPRYRSLVTRELDLT